MPEEIQGRGAPSEAWLCAGQSNIEMAASACSDCEEIAAEALGAGVSVLRDGEWTKIDASNVRSFSGTAVSFAARRSKSLGRSVGVAVAARGGTRIEAWMPRAALEESVHGRRMIALAESPDVVAAAEEDRKVSRPYYETALSRWLLGRALPMEHFERLIRPLTGIGFKGVVWYQGESNADTVPDALLYESLLISLIPSWRLAFGKPAMPFVVAGLPLYEPDPETGPRWDLLRKSQRAAVEKTANASFVDCYDLGDPNDIHPKRKLELGRRLADAASALC